MPCAATMVTYTVVDMDLNIYIYEEEGGQITKILNWNRLQYL